TESSNYTSVESYKIDGQCTQLKYYTFHETRLECEKDNEEVFETNQEIVEQELDTSKHNLVGHYENGQKTVVQEHAYGQDRTEIEKNDHGTADLQQKTVDQGDINTCEQKNLDALYTNEFGR